MITAPFNFVPLNDKVFFPDWVDDVSFDIPFEDGESGVIDITIKAENPIFVRDSNQKEKFCNYEGNYYIPGSSVKGMVRTVLEIMSFGKLKFFDDNTYSVRDLNLKNKKVYMDNIKNVKAGWLYFEDGELFIQDCGEPYRIRYDEIDKKFDIDFKKNFLRGNFNNSNSPYKQAEKKYELLKDLTGIDFLNKSFKFKNAGNDANRKVVEFDNRGDIEGKIVLTGHPSPRDESRDKPPSGKIYDFVFCVNSDKKIKVSKEVFEIFKFNYFDGRTTEPKESKDWKYWKEKLYNGEKIPVFFQKDGDSIKNFGLSYLYKLPYKHSIKDGIFKEHFNEKRDLDETIFGYETDKDGNGLKGRVSFSHFFAVENVRELEKQQIILGTPRASYYPIYIKQNGGIYKTYMDDSFMIAGRKRYPIRNNIVINNDLGDNQKVPTTITPLDSGVVFKGKIRYFNLKKVELGAILSALTFHNTEGCYHNIGMAKPYGYGKVSIKIDGIEIENYLKEFEKIMRLNISEWEKTPQITELLTMATPQNNNGNSKLEYMELREFAKIKNNDEYLKSYSELDNIVKKEINLLLDDEVIELVKKEELFENEFKTISKVDDVNQIDSFIRKYENENFVDSAKIEELKNIVENIRESRLKNKFDEVNQRAERAFEEVKKKKGTKGFEKAKSNFIKKWSKEKENKGSEFVLELIEKMKKGKF